MDRVSVRSFRASDLAERAIKDLARSRLDTGREVVFQPLGARFLEARDDAARIVALLREDAFHAETGYFTRMTLRVDSQLPTGSPAWSRVPWSGGWKKRHAMPSCGSFRGPRASTWPVSSPRLAAASSPSRMST